MYVIFAIWQRFSPFNDSMIMFFTLFCAFFDTLLASSKDIFLNVIVEIIMFLISKILSRKGNDENANIVILIREICII